MDKIKQRSNKPKYENVKIYKYVFSDGNTYIGYTSGDLNFRHNQYKTIPITPLFDYLNREKEYEGPTYIKTVKINIKNNHQEIYEEILAKCDINSKNLIKI